MNKLSKIFKQITEKGFASRNPANSPDSVFSRSMSNRKVLKKKKDGNEQQANGADIAKKMDFDIEPKKSVHDSEPLSMMDVVYSTWGLNSKKRKDK